MIEAGHLSRSFGGRLAGDGVSFRVAPGEIAGFLGPIGGGKSTMLKMLAGRISPTEDAP